MNSCLYEGRVRHRRRAPKEHCFNFDLYMILLDLEEVDEVFAGRWLWSTRRPALARFRSDDHLKSFDNSLPLREKVLETLRQHGCTRAIGAVRLLTQLRYLGFEMNPVSFFYCYDEQDQDLVAIIAEVNNTPWGEQHVYVVENPSKTRIGKTRIANTRIANTRIGKTILAEQIDKDFHVSPFMSLEMFYRMLFTRPGNQIGVKIENFELDGDSSENPANRIFDVAMRLRRKPITSWNLNRVLISYPLISFKVFAGIYWQALRLYLKQVPFYPHPNRKRSGMTDPASAVPQDSNPNSLQTIR